MQERMGTLPAVELLCQALTEQEGILETTPGRRLQGTAFAPEIQVSTTGHARSVSLVQPRAIHPDTPSQWQVALTIASTMSAGQYRYTGTRE